MTSMSEVSSKQKCRRQSSDRSEINSTSNCEIKKMNMMESLHKGGTLSMTLPIYYACLVYIYMCVCVCVGDG